MNKVYTCCFLLLFSWIGQVNNVFCNDYPQRSNGSEIITLFLESFEGENMPPDDWLLEEDEPLTLALSPETVHPEKRKPYDGSQLAYFNSWDPETENKTAKLITPEFDASHPKTVFSFAMYRDNEFPDKDDEINLKISTDGGDTWSHLAGPYKRYYALGKLWTTFSVDIKAGKPNTRISIECTGKGGNDVHIDKVHAYVPDEVDLAMKSVFPGYVVEGSEVTPKIALKNIGMPTDDSWSVTLTDNVGYSSTINGKSLQTGESLLVAMDAWVPSAGNKTLKAVINYDEDADKSNNSMEITVIVGAGYLDAYAGNGFQSMKWGSLDLENGEVSDIADISSLPFPSGEEYDGTYIYRIHSNNTIGIVYPNGTYEEIAAINMGDMEGACVGLAYDWENDRMYTNVVRTEGSLAYAQLCLLDMEQYSVTLIGESNHHGYMRGLDMAYDGNLYCVSITSATLFKVDPVTAEFTSVGYVGQSLYFGQDLSYDGMKHRMYTINCDGYVDARFGFYDLKTGAFNEIKNYGNDFFMTIVITKTPTSACDVTISIIDNEGLVPEATVAIGDEIYTTDQNGKINNLFGAGTYQYTITKFGYETKSGSITLSNALESIEIAIDKSPTYNIDFYITNINETELDAFVSIMFEGEELYAGTTQNGQFLFQDIPSNTYSYSVHSESYESVLNEELVLDGDMFIDIVLEEITEFIPFNLEIETQDTSAVFSWNNQYGLESFEDDFESGDFSAWDSFIQGLGEIGPQAGNPYWYVYDTEGTIPVVAGNHVAFVDWGYNIDTWLITPFIAVDANTTVNFFFYTHYSKFVDPQNNGDLLVRVLPMGSDTWETIWKEDDYGVFETRVWYEVDLSLEKYAGRDVQIAFNLVGDDTQFMLIDGIKIGQDSKKRGLQYYEVFLDDSPVATTTSLNYTLTGLEEGRTYKAGVRTVYETGHTETVSLEFTTKTDVSINNIHTHNLKVFPNPATDWVRVTNGGLPINSIQMLDITGRLLYKEANRQSTETTISLSDFTKGIYIIDVDGQNIKVIKN